MYGFLGYRMESIFEVNSQERRSKIEVSRLLVSDEGFDFSGRCEARY